MVYVLLKVTMNTEYAFQIWIDKYIDRQIDR